ncbi:MAG: respiratory chain complex I subunit 1 family protein [Thermoanaerobaculaceae bacterium]
MIASLVGVLAGLVLAPLLGGVINRVKAIFAGRRGQPLMQPYRDLGRLLHKGAVYSPTTTALFRLGPAVSVAAGIVALAVLPLGGSRAPVAFSGDFLLLLGLLAAARFCIVLAALDTGSAFEGMGASREVAFSALAEPAVLLAVGALVRATDVRSLSGAMGGVWESLWKPSMPAAVLVAAAIAVVLLCENARIPFDDPNTHLELTMIHEVMVLDHSGPDFGLVLYGGALKLWIFSALLAGVLVPVRTGSPWLDATAAVGGTFCVAVAVGVVESTMARLRLVRVPQLLVGAAVMAALAVLLVR